MEESGKGPEELEKLDGEGPYCVRACSVAPVMPDSL